MIRRILVIGSIGLALAGGARFAWKELTDRAWEERKGELLALAIFQPELKRPWEVRFASIQERLLSSPSFREVSDSGHKPYAALGNGEPRALDDLERVWMAAIWHELGALEGVLAELRKLPLAAFEWHGPTASLLVQREITNALCGRAWLALDGGDDAAAAGSYADALRLARAADDGTTMGGMTRCACERTVLASLRSALSSGFSPGTARTALVPLLEDLAYSPDRAQYAIRRDLSYVGDLTEREEEPWPTAYALQWHAGVEEALGLVRGPAEELIRLQDAEREEKSADGSPQCWIGLALQLHELHAVRNVALTALAVAAFREEHGAFPASLSELAEMPPEHARDPLAGTPLPYSLADSGARIGPAAWGERVDAPEDLDDSLYVWTLR